MVHVSRMQLEKCVLSMLHIEQNTNASPDHVGDVSYDIDVETNVRKHVSELKFLVDAQFTFTWKEETAPLKKICVGIKGVYSFPEETDEDTIQQFVPLLCITNLYGTARGIVAQASGLFPGGPFLLPLIDMTSLIKPSEDIETPVPTKKTRRKRVKQDTDIENEQTHTSE